MRKEEEEEEEEEETLALADVQPLERDALGKNGHQRPRRRVTHGEVRY